MNGYAFEFDGRGRIVPSRIYDRTGFPGNPDNIMRPFVPALQAFADATRFRTFFADNAATYREQERFYRESAGVPEMKRWLDAQFPGAQPYDAYKIVFSPLVHANQSTTWFVSNGFRELQPHVNYPYAARTRGLGCGRPAASEREHLSRTDRVHRTEPRIYQSAC